MIPISLEYKPWERNKKQYVQVDAEQYASGMGVRDTPLNGGQIWIVAL